MPSFCQYIATPGSLKLVRLTWDNVLIIAAPIALSAEALCRSGGTIGCQGAKYRNNALINFRMAS
jgi:hypothetical protein